MTEVSKTCLDWYERGIDHSIAVVVKTWGSSPRPVGSLMAVRSDGFVVGSVSGGCVETAVIEECLGFRSPKLLHFSESGEAAWDVGLSCGGEIDVLVTRPEGSAYAEYLRASIEGRRHSWHIKLPNGSDFELVADLRPRLIIIGAVHIAVPLVQIARILGYRCVLIEPRTALAVPEKFSVVPDSIIVRWPSEALQEVPLDALSHAILLTHDPKIDLPALRVLLKSKVAYIGALGSRKTHAQRTESLRSEGFSEIEISRIHGPIGLAIGAKTPEEIAISILGQVIQYHRQGP